VSSVERKTTAQLLFNDPLPPLRLAGRSDEPRRTMTIEVSEDVYQKLEEDMAGYEGYDEEEDLSGASWSTKQWDRYFIRQDEHIAGLVQRIHELSKLARLQIDLQSARRQAAGLVAFIDSQLKGSVS